jgi:hypothetical protein
MLLGACSQSVDPDPRLRIETARAQYLPGETVSLTIENLTSAEIFQFNTCYSTLQRREGTRWSDVAIQQAWNCPDNLSMVAAGETQTGFAGIGPLPSSLSPGVTYRYRVDALYTPSHAPLPLIDRLSAPFLVVRP